MTNTRRLMTSASLQKIMSKRITVPAIAEGKRVKLTVQGNGNIIPVLNKAGEQVFSTTPDEHGVLQPLYKRIFNLAANSAIAMSNPAVRQLIIDGLAAEKAGDAGKADEAFSEYLNRTQMSFGVILPSATADKLVNNTEISARVEKVTTDNGSLLTIDASSISVLEPETYGATTFKLEDFVAAEPATELADGTAQSAAEVLADAKA